MQIAVQWKSFWCVDAFLEHLEISSCKHQLVGALGQAVKIRSHQQACYPPPDRGKLARKGSLQRRLDCIFFERMRIFVRFWHQDCVFVLSLYCHRGEKKNLGTQSKQMVQKEHLFSVCQCSSSTNATDKLLTYNRQDITCASIRFSQRTDFNAWNEQFTLTQGYRPRGSL